MRHPKNKPRSRSVGKSGAHALSHCSIKTKSPRKRTVKSIKRGNVYHTAARRGLLSREHRQPSGYDD